MSKFRISDKNNPGSLFVPAGALVGMGVGSLINNFLAGLFIGVGVGFVLFALTTVFYRSK